jgi:hypothetical protein
MGLKNQRLLLIVAVSLGVLPFILRSVGAGPSLFLGIVVLVLNLLVCVLGARTPYRLFWLIYAGSCVVAFVLFGMSSPFALILLLFAL